MPLVARKLVLERLDLQSLRLGQFNQAFRRYAQFGRIGRQGFGRCKHTDPIADQHGNGNPTPLDLVINYQPSKAAKSALASTNQYPPTSLKVAQVSH